MGYALFLRFFLTPKNTLGELCDLNGAYTNIKMNLIYVIYEYSIQKYTNNVFTNSPRVLDFLYIQMEKKCRKMKTSGKLVQYV